MTSTDDLHMSNFDANNLISSPLAHHLQTDRTSSFSFHPKEAETPFPKNSGPLSDALLETPTDLVCPITFQVFQDPVITSSGQVIPRLHSCLHKGEIIHAKDARSMTGYHRSIRIHTCRCTRGMPSSATSKRITMTQFPACLCALIS